MVSKAQFKQMFPDRNSFYSYGDLVAAMAAYRAFAATGDKTVRKQEAAAFLANVSRQQQEAWRLIHKGHLKAWRQMLSTFPQMCL